VSLRYSGARPLDYLDVPLTSQHDDVELVRTLMIEMVTHGTDVIKSVRSMCENEWLQVRDACGFARV